MATRPPRRRSGRLNLQAFRPLAAALAAALLLSVPDSGRADVYTWTDEHGNVHFSDVPRAGAKRTGIGEKSREAAPADAGSEPVPYAGTEPSRRLLLEQVSLDLPYDEGTSRRIGAGYSGYHCAPVADLMVDGSEPLRATLAFANDFHRRLDSLGYRRPDVSRASSGVARRKVAELTMIGSVNDIEVKSCEDRWVSSTRAPPKNYVRVEVNWRVYDNLTQELVYERRTPGLYDRWNRHYGKHESTQLLEATRQALLQSAEQLLEDESFVRLLDPIVALDGSESPVAPPAALDRSDIELRRLSAPGSFQSRLRALKSATVTVRTVSGHGSGFVISDGGYVLTNHHVIENSSRVVVVFAAREIHGTVIAADRDRDVALIQLAEPSPVQALAVSASGIESGETVYVIGTPFDESLSHTVTRGIISAHRKLKGRAFYQTDAAVHPGNSGGPAFDEMGEVVALAVAGITDKQGRMLGINYLIPIEDGLRALGIGTDR